MEKPKVTILVIDDEKIIHESCGRVLQEEGFEVETALSGQEALEKLKKKRYNLVLSDIKMPGMSGVETLEKMKKRDPRYYSSNVYRVLLGSDCPRYYEAGCLRLYTKTLYSGRTSRGG